MLDKAWPGMYCGISVMTSWKDVAVGGLPGLGSSVVTAIWSHMERFRA